MSPPRSPYLDYETKADLRLPFEGDWFVFWGGRTVEENYHAIVRRSAICLRPPDRARRQVVHRQTARSLEDYYCWGEPILAPAAGTVLATVTGAHPDMAPGEMDPSNPAGNHVILDLGNDEYALLAHFMHDSIVVSAGDEVVAGRYSWGGAATAAIPANRICIFTCRTRRTSVEGDGKPAFFNDYLSNGEPVERGEPRRGETISPSRLGPYLARLFAEILGCEVDELACTEKQRVRLAYLPFDYSCRSPRSARLRRGSARHHHWPCPDSRPKRASPFSITGYRCVVVRRFGVRDSA